MKKINSKSGGEKTSLQTIMINQLSNYIMKKIIQFFKRLFGKKNNNTTTSDNKPYQEHKPLGGDLL